MRNKYYAGIGSRKTPEYVLKKMKAIAEALEKKGFILRSGGAEGADSAFESGSKNNEIFRAEDATNEALNLTSRYHPNWNACSEYTKKLHARNAMIILGKNLNSPVEFVWCWTKNGKGGGGTGQALRIAEDYGIKIYDLGEKYE